MRKFLRHPSDIPINISSEGEDAQQSSNLQNMSHGGLCCEVDYYIEVGTVISINIPLVKPVYTGQGMVVWCLPRGHHFELGIRFCEAKEAFKSHMIEQVCQIEHYKMQVRKEEGRELDGEQAAKEWIDKHAADFAQDG